MAKRGGLIFKFSALLFYTFLYLPIIVLIAFSFNAARVNAVWVGFTWQWYVALFNDAGIYSALKNSLFISTLTAIFASIVGTMAAHALADKKRGNKTLFLAMLYLPLIVPDIVIGIALATLYTSVSLTLGLTTLILSHLVFDSAYVTIIVLARLESYDRRIEEAAMDLGATPTRTIWTIRLPLIFPAVVAGTLLAFTLSFDDFVISFMTSGVGTTTLPIRIYSMTRFGVSPIINALSTLILIFTSISIFLVQRLMTRHQVPSKLLSHHPS